MNLESNKKYTLIVNIPGDWHKGFHRQALVYAFAQHPEIERIFVIGNPADLFHSPVKKIFRLKHALKSLFKTDRYNEKIWVFTPLVFMHYLVGFRIPVIRKINKIMFNLCMKRLLKREAINSNILVSVCRPEYIDFIEFSGNMKIIYDCYDEHLTTSNDQSIKYLEEIEQQLIKKSSFIFTTSTKLQSKSQQFNWNCYFIPNAADVELFSKAYTSNFKMPSDMVAIPEPRIGYVGVFRNWIDVDLLEYLFNNNPDKSFVFIGNWLKHANKIVENFQKRKNVIFLGRKKIEDIPIYLKYINVVIIPNRRNIFNQNVLPYKLYEYLAAGKKIISTNTSVDLQMYYSEYIEIADTKEEFSKKIDDLLNDTNFDYEKVFNFGKKQSWDNRVETMMNIINKKLS